MFFSFLSVLYFSLTSALDLPVVDLSADPAVIASQIHAAASVSGFFQVINHGLSAELRGKVLQQARELFALEMEYKLSMVRNDTHYGYVPSQQMTLNHEQSIQADTHEAWILGDESNPSYGQDIGTANTNQVPSDSLLPDFSAVTAAYYKVMVELGKTMNEHLNTALKLPPGYFKENLFSTRWSPLRYIHYPPVQSEEGKIYGVGSHSDWGILTFLITDGTPGLQLLNREDQKWHNVSHLEEGIVVNVADMLERYTNDEYVSSKHRVFMHESVDRYSVALFWSPGPFATVECLPTICQQPKYEPVVLHDYIRSKILESYQPPEEQAKGEL